MRDLARRRDAPGLIYLATWIVALTATGALVLEAGSGIWQWLAMFAHGVVLTVPAYSFSHETAHGTAFRTRWLNEAVLWLTSLIYLEEPLHRRYTHTNHHTYTWHVGKDSQMPFDTPMTISGWLAEVSGVALLRFHMVSLINLAIGRYSGSVVDVAPESELPKMTRNARFFVLIYLLIAGLIIAGHFWLLAVLVIPRIIGAPVMLLFTLIQHVELKENSPSILESTRTFQTNVFARWIYMNMNNHVEHHLYPQIPFYALPKLREALKDQTPTPDRGFIRINLDVFWIVLRRSLNFPGAALSIRQASHMATAGASKRISRRTM